MSALTSLPAWMQRSKIEDASAFPAWLLEYRQKQWHEFLKTGLPTKKEERWKYTDLSFLTTSSFSGSISTDEPMLDSVIKEQCLPNTITLVLVNGHFSTRYSQLSKLPAGVIACSLLQACQQYPTVIQQYWPHQTNHGQSPFITLNDALFADGLFLLIPKQCKIDNPIHFLSIATTDNIVSHPRHLIVLEAQATITLFEEYMTTVNATYFSNVVSHILLGREAVLNRIKLQTENKTATHLAHTIVQQDQDSQAALVNVAEGGQFSRDELMVRLQGPGADCKTYGLYCSERDNQYIDNHVEIEHQAPHSTSEMLYKGILDKSSKAVFNGRLLVKKDAQKIVAFQANHNLLLSKTAEANSKPELEIYADDVKCKHGATTGQIDEEAMFYLRSRGIPHNEARHMLLRGFAEEVLMSIGEVSIREKVEAKMRRYF